jgi:transcriptional regulator with XRE-family HTH domain
MDIKTKFGNHLKQLRTNHNLTQEKLAELANMDRSYISDIERGLKSISIEKLEQLANAFNTELCELLNFNR